MTSLFYHPLAIIDQDGYLMRDDDDSYELELTLITDHDRVYTGTQISPKFKIEQENNIYKTESLKDGRIYKIVTQSKNGLFFADGVRKYYFGPLGVN